MSKQFMVRWEGDMQKELNKCEKELVMQSLSKAYPSALHHKNKRMVVESETSHCYSTSKVLTITKSAYEWWTRASLNGWE